MSSLIKVPKFLASLVEFGFLLFFSATPQHQIGLNVVDLLIDLQRSAINWSNICNLSCSHVMQSNIYAIQQKLCILWNANGSVHWLKLWIQTTMISNFQSNIDKKPRTNLHQQTYIASLSVSQSHIQCVDLLCEHHQASTFRWASSSLILWNACQFRIARHQVCELGILTADPILLLSWLQFWPTPFSPTTLLEFPSVGMPKLSPKTVPTTQDKIEIFQCRGQP